MIYILLLIITLYTLAQTGYANYMDAIIFFATGVLIVKILE